jgi:hypothetical protein
VPAGTSRSSPDRRRSRRPSRARSSRWRRSRSTWPRGTSSSSDPDGSKALDIAISEFSNRPLAELASNAARDKAKAELRKKINKAYEGHVMDVYFTEFVMQ